MTFYWWSHWFWITFLSVHLLPNAITHVHTYPSQEVSIESTLRQDAGQAQAERQQTTKLYQTTASQTWATSSTQRNVMDLTLKTTAAPVATPAGQAAYMDVDAGPQGVDVDDVESPITDADVEADDEAEEDDEDNTTADASEADNVDADADANVDADADADGDEAGHEENAKLALSHNQFEFKRSADFATVPGDSEQLNNYTNFSRITSTNPNSNEKKASNVTSSSSNSNADNSGVRGSSTLAMSTSTSTAKATAESTTTSTSTSTSPSSTSPPNSSLGHTATAATPSTPKINTEWLSDELQKAPFTLENANKEDELRRAETEHRSRKSKVLSAEYKHINRYINFSSDTKSLLTRSAAATPSVSGYNSDEGNISSEALAIQRTYFLDAGAISAICFTVFGVCCTVGTIGIVLYRRRYVNKPQALSEPDSSIYIDDSTMRVSDNSDEMYSLDNDSFLNSLEAMTIQNYWTDTVKHTKL